MKKHIQEKHEFPTGVSPVNRRNLNEKLFRRAIRNRETKAAVFFGELEPWEVDDIA